MCTADCDRFHFRVSIEIPLERVGGRSVRFLWDTVGQWLAHFLDKFAEADILVATNPYANGVLVYFCLPAPVTTIPPSIQEWIASMSLPDLGAEVVSVGLKEEVKDASDRSEH